MTVTGDSPQTGLQRKGLQRRRRGGRRGQITSSDVSEVAASYYGTRPITPRRAGLIRAGPFNRGAEFEESGGGWKTIKDT